MKKIFKDSGIRIPKEFENSEFYKKIKKELTRRSKDYATSTYITNEFYVEDKDYLTIPRYFPIQDYIINNMDLMDINIDDISNEGKDINISHKIKFRNNLQEKAADYMLNNNNGIIQLNPGVGKTVISIYMVCERKKKTIILVHKDYLANQWYKRFLDHTNISEDDIIRLNSTNYKKAFQKSIIIITDQTFMSLVKRKKDEFLKELYNSNIGIFISDECHTTTGAPLFSKCSLYIPSKVNFGLSATPYRYDGNVDIIEFHLGPIFSDSSVEGTMKAKVTIIAVDYLIDIPYRQKYIWWAGEFQKSRYLNLIKSSKPFLSIAKGLLNKFKDNKKILFVSERIKLIDDMYKWIDTDSKGKFVGGSKDEELNEKIIFSTPGKIRDGVDVPDIDCLIMTSPISNIKQMCGRVVRSNPDKDIPIIIDMVDYGCNMIFNSIFNRLEYYESQEWDVQILHSLKNNIIKINKDELFDLGNKNKKI